MFPKGTINVSALVDDPASKVHTNYTQIRSISVSEGKLLFIKVHRFFSATRNHQNTFIRLYGLINILT